MDSNIVFRVEASAQMGMGHLARCRVLAQALQARGARIHFWCSDATWQSLARDAAIGQYRRLAQLTALPGKPDWLVVDHYGLDGAWEREQRPHVQRLMAIDDIARAHACDLLLDQNLFADPAARYAGKVAGDCLMLLGPTYALLRPGIAAARRQRIAQTDHGPRLFICFGGSDTLLVERAVDALTDGMAADIVIGADHPAEARLAARCAQQPQWRLHINHPAPEELMVRATIAIGAGGTMNWERFAVGVPSVVISIADNQRAICEVLQARGLVHYLGDAESVDAAMIRHAAQGLLQDDAVRRTMEAGGAQLVDGAGAPRVAAAMLA